MNRWVFIVASLACLAGVDRLARPFRTRPKLVLPAERASALLPVLSFVRPLLAQIHLIRYHLAREAGEVEGHVDLAWQVLVLWPESERLWADFGAYLCLDLPAEHATAARRRRWVQEGLQMFDTGLDAFRETVYLRHGKAMVLEALARFAPEVLDDPGASRREALGLLAQAHRLAGADHELRDFIQVDLVSAVIAALASGEPGDVERARNEARRLLDRPDLPDSQRDALTHALEHPGE